MEAFTPSKSLLNPKFEGYKLDVSQQETVTHYPLDYRPTQATISGRSPFSFQEVESRIRHNHLSVCNHTNRAAYIDAASRVVLVDVNVDTTVPSFSVLFQVPTPIRASHDPHRNREYPSSAFLNLSSLCISDGAGLMYLLKIKEDGGSQVLGVFTLSMPATDIPFRIHGVYRISPVTAVILLSSRYHPTATTTESERETQPTSKTPAQTEFFVFAAKVELLSLQPSNGIRRLDVLWSRQGRDAPIYTTYQEELKSFLLVGGSPYSQDGHAHLQLYEPSPDEIAPIPRSNENLDAASLAPKPPPYSWSQTSDSVTVAIPLPSNTPKHTIKVTFSQRTLTVHIDNDVPTSLPVPRYSAKALWDDISPSTSYWTWDREAEHTFGLLTLYLDKHHEGTRWSQVFASSSDTVTSGPSDEDGEVPETLDPSELWQIREALEKYTTALCEGDGASGLGLGLGMPSLAEGEIDMEVDETIGRASSITWVGETGTVPRWHNSSFQLLSTPLPHTNLSYPSFVVKNNLDGTVFSLALSEHEGQVIPKWSHTSTFSALAFVLASKRDTRYTYHSPEAVFAFDGGTQDQGGNIYIYRTASVKDRWAKQAILKVGGPLVGAGVVKTKDTSLLVCLTEGELIIIRGILT